MLEWLLKYPLDWYVDGSLGLTWSWYQYTLALLLLAVLLLWLAGYRRVGHAPLVFTPRLLLIAALLLSLAQPVLTVDAPEPIAGHVAVLLDDSLSMRIGDADGESSGDRLAALFDAEGDSLATELEENVETRYFRFGEGVQPIDAGTPLDHADARSELGNALLRVASGHDAAALTGVVVASDGANLPDALDRERMERALIKLKAAGVPVQVIRLGNAQPQPDIELSALRVPRRILVQDSVDLEIDIVQHGYAGRRVMLMLEEDGIILNQQELVLPPDGEQQLVRHRLSFAEPGRRMITARIDPMQNETNIENNHLDRSLSVDDGPIRVLHFEGEPRFEVKFLRRAVADDPVIQLTSLIRTAENKYYRLGIESPSELANGFPQKAAELFRYDVLVLGSVEAKLLTPEQQAAIRDFVARRGGGLVLLGGHGAFAEGGHAASVLADLMPVVLTERSGGFRAEIKAQLTDAGNSDPLFDIVTDETRQALFQRLPPLTVVNPLRQAKPGASVLLRGEDQRGEPLILFAAQHYGRGRVVSFAVRDSWRWQMHAEIPLSDLTHERLWRQMLRDLGRNAAGRVRLRLRETETTPGTSVTVEAQALNDKFHPHAQAELTLVVTTPPGEIQRLPMTPLALGQGRFQAQFVPRESGRHDISVELADETDVVARTNATLDVFSSGREFHGYESGQVLLARLAQETGGRLLDASDADELPALLDTAQGERRVFRRLPLWDAPLLLLVMVLLACAEWALRRARKLA